MRADTGDADPATLRVRGDAAAEMRLRADLELAASLDAVLSEDAADDRRRLTANRVWIIDPLDGTREYAEGRDDWAVHVALWSRGELRADAVALPDAGLTLTSASAPTVPSSAGRPPRVLISRSRPPDEAELVRTAVNGKTVAMGSAGAKAMAVVRGLGDIYVHAGGPYEWDSAAPVAVALAAGLHASALDGVRRQRAGLQPRESLATGVVDLPTGVRGNGPGGACGPGARLTPRRDGLRVSGATWVEDFGGVVRHVW